VQEIFQVFTAYQQHPAIKLFFFILLYGFNFAAAQQLAQQRVQSKQKVTSIVQQKTSRANNACGVTASFFPGVDTFFTTDRQFDFVNTSINATSIEWRLNGFYYSTSNAFSLYFSAGLYKLSLVARNGSCTDTLTILIVCTGIPPADNNYFSGSAGIDGHSDIASNITASADGGFLLGGSTEYKGNSTFKNVLLVKVKEENCIEWTRILNKPNKNIRLQMTHALKDGGFLLSADANYSNFLMKLNAPGQMVWVKSYSSVARNINIRRLYEMNDGSIIATTSDFNTGVSILKLDNLGNVLWDRYLQKESNGSDYMTSTAIFEWGNALYVSGNYKAPDNPPFVSGAYVPYLIKLNSADGKLNWSYSYPDSETRSTYFSDIHRHGNRLLLSAINYYTLGGGGADPCLLWFDTSGVPVKSAAVHHNSFEQSAPAFVKAGVLPGGNLLMFFKGKQQMIITPPKSVGFYFKFDSSLTILQEQQSFTQETAGLDVCITEKGFAATGSQYSRIVPWLTISENFHFSKRDSSGANGGCTYNTSFFSVKPFALQRQALTWAKDTVLNVYTIPDQEVQIIEEYTQIRSECPAYVDSCSVLLIKGTQSVCNTSKSYTYKAGRNSKCPQAVEWTYTGNLTVLNETDSSITVQFNSFGNFTISAFLKNSCTPVKDSILINAVPVVSAPLNIGPDQSLCSGNSFKLHASPLYSNYRWQDGSTDSVFNVTAAGLYWVEVTDACENVYRDSVLVTNAAAISLNAGPDRTKCNNDTLHLTAPTGYLHYNWTTTSGFTDTSRTITINPLSNTLYFLAAELNPGCFGYDTIPVTVYQSAPVFIGNDTSVCTGDSIVYSAATGFMQYLWNNGAGGSQIKVSKPGMYSVIASSAEGCKSYDTASIVSNYPLPAVTITGSDVICKGTDLTLDAGNIPGAAIYLWSTGEQSSSIPVNNIGVYSVAVTNGNGCTGRDSFRVSRIAEPPAFFLPPDTTICSYSTLVLNAKGTYNSYLWSTNDFRSSISVSQPGLFLLTVTDQNNCRGTDSIRVVTKDCLTGCFVPNAFTPNHDGLNDVFKPLLFGRLSQYEFSVYNRWGKRIFYTTDITKGWDGTVTGILQDSNEFVWVCSYRFEGEERKNARGTVQLIR